ncbi:MAG: hypothetical protein ACI8PZ_000393 [Myxococcota bacterium]|jgi:hypothetical protein
MLLWLALSAPSHAVDLTLSGSCPGEFRVNVTDATVSGMVAVLVGTDGAGSDPVPAGPCAGLATELAGIRLVGGLQVDWDFDGAHQLDLDVSGPRCGAVLQALDLGTCTLSPARGFVEAPIDLGGVYASYESESRMVHVWQSDPSAPLDGYDTFCEDRGLGWFEPVSAPDAQRLIDEAYGYDEWHTWIITKTPTHGAESTFGGYPVVVNGPGGDEDADGFTAIRRWSSSFCDPDDYGVTRCWDADHAYDWLVCQE